MSTKRDYVNVSKERSGYEKRPPKETYVREERLCQNAKKEVYAQKKKCASACSDHGVAATSRLIQIIGLFCKRDI